MQTRLQEKSSSSLLTMLIRQITLLSEEDLQTVWTEHFPDPEKREYYEELGRMFPSFKSRMMGMDIHGLFQAAYTVDKVGEEFFHNFTLKHRDNVLAHVVDSSLDSAWKRAYLIATEVDAVMG